MAELLKVGAFLFDLVPRDVLYLFAIIMILIMQRIKTAEKTQCPSHIYLVYGLDYLKKHAKWSSVVTREMAVSMDIKLEPEPIEEDPLLRTKP